jgi:hypothetical protein
MDDDKKKMLFLVGFIPPYTCSDEYSDQMREFYLLKSKDALPDLKWELKELVKSSDGLEVKE